MIETKNSTDDLEKQIKIFKYIIMFLIIIVTILVFLLIGEYTILNTPPLIQNENLSLYMPNIFKTLKL